MELHTAFSSRQGSCPLGIHQPFADPAPCSISGRLPPHPSWMLSFHPCRHASTSARNMKSHSRPLICWQRQTLTQFSLSPALCSFSVGADAAGRMLHCYCRCVETPLKGSNLASKSTANKLLQRVLSCNVSPSWFWEHCSVGNHISWYVTVTVLSEEGQTCGNTSLSLEVNGCFSAQIYNLIEKLREREELLVNTALNQHFFQWAPAQPITYIRGLTTETFREEDKTRMRQTMVSLAHQ